MEAYSFIILYLMRGLIYSFCIYQLLMAEKLDSGHLILLFMLASLLKGN